MQSLNQVRQSVRDSVSSQPVKPVSTSVSQLSVSRSDYKGSLAVNRSVILTVVSQFLSPCPPRHQPLSPAPESLTRRQLTDHWPSVSCVYSITFVQPSSRHIHLLFPSYNSLLLAWYQLISMSTLPPSRSSGSPKLGGKFTHHWPSSPRRAQHQSPPTNAAQYRR